jgi:hypothetical protein
MPNNIYVLSGITMPRADKDSAKVPILSAVLALCVGSTFAVTSNDVVYLLNRQGFTFEPEAVRMNLMRYAKHGILSRRRQERGDINSPVFLYGPSERTASALHHQRNAQEESTKIARLRVDLNAAISAIGGVKSQMQPLLDMPSRVQGLESQVTWLRAILLQLYQSQTKLSQTSSQTGLRAPKVGDISYLRTDEPIIKEGKVVADDLGMPSYKTSISPVRWDGRKWVPFSGGEHSEPRPQDLLRPEDWKAIDDLARLSSSSSGDAKTEAEGDRKRNKKKRSGQ